ncbi:hypothetical protein Ddc_09470 [Ditylenchus destructor]|nr:hypothetical protein Ddc_09470 [Ditylenchus destructor]
MAERHKQAPPLRPKLLPLQRASSTHIPLIPTILGEVPKNHTEISMNVFGGHCKVIKVDRWLVSVIIRAVRNVLPSHCFAGQTMPMDLNEK